jgi:hypothetical protein
MEDASSSRVSNQLEPAVKKVKLNDNHSLEHETEASLSFFNG